jgi:hypothetical protein
MRSTVRSLVVVVAACVGLVASVFTAFASPIAAAGADSLTFAQWSPPRAPVQSVAPAGCDQLQASGVAWVTLTPDHHVDKQVTSYASGTSSITPIFQYNCIPDNTTVVTVFSLNGQTIFSDKEALAARTTAALYGYDLETNDGSPLSDGEWDVQFFNNKTALSGGSVVVGNTSGDPAQTSSATVQGVVQDKDSQAPIQGADILVLKPGVKTQDFLQNGQQQSDVFTAGQSDSQGAFTLHDKLERHRVYSMIIAVEGYKTLGNDSFQINNEPDPVSINIAMTK